MQSEELSQSLSLLFSELVNGSPPAGAYILNPNDPGLLRSLEGLSAGQASEARDGGATVAAHVAHLTYGLSLLNRWAAGEEPFTEADWSSAWRTTAVSGTEWTHLLAHLTRETSLWQSELEAPREVSGTGLHGMIASVAHLAYHFGSIRQIAAAARGPRDPADPGTG